MIPALIAVGSVLTGILILLLFLRNRFRLAMEEVSRTHPEHDRLLTAPMANFFGVRSGGMKQVRGNGILILTRDRLYFRMLLPKRELTIPLDTIISVGKTRSFLGKTKGRDLLQVDFTGDSGEADSAAWLVGDLQEWLTGLGES